MLYHSSHNWLDQIGEKIFSHSLRQPRKGKYFSLQSQDDHPEHFPDVGFHTYLCPGSYQEGAQMPAEQIIKKLQSKYYINQPY